MSVPIEFEVGLAPQPAWTFLRKETSFAPTGSRTPYRPVHSIVTVLATLYLKETISDDLEPPSPSYLQDITFSNDAVILLQLHYYYYYYYKIWMSLVTGFFFLVLLLKQR